MPQLVIPGITDPATLACISRARQFNQFCHMVADAKRGHCPFCHIDRERNRIIDEDYSFRVWPCNPPEKHTKWHFLIVPKKHVTNSRGLTDEEFLAIMRTPSKLAERFGFLAHGILIREEPWDMAGTIAHWHLHCMVPDGTGRVESPFYKGTKSEAESLARAIVFEKLRQETEPIHLTDEEWNLVKDRVPPEMTRDPGLATLFHEKPKCVETVPSDRIPPKSWSPGPKPVC